MLAKKNLHKVNQALIIWFTALFEHFFSNELIQWLVILKNNTFETFERH